MHAPMLLLEHLAMVGKQALDQCGACAGIKTRSDVLAMGIDKYNEECRSIVMRYAAYAALSKPAGP